MANSPGVDDLDRITEQELRAHGSLKWTLFDRDTIGAFVAEMDFGVAGPVLTALQDAVAQASFGYLPPRLAGQLAQACADWQQRRYGWPVAPEQVFPVSDVLTAFELVLRHFSAPGTPVILPTPAYMPFLTVPQRHGREVLQVPMTSHQGRYALDLDALAAAFRAGGQLLVLCHPANPVGRVFTRDELAQVTAVVDQYGGRVFADEVHAPLTYPEHPHLPYAATSPAAAAHTLTATAASKAWNLPGLKCAQVIVSNPADATLWREISGASSAPSNLGAVAAVAAYHSGEPWLDGVLRYLDGNRQRLAQFVATRLPAVGYRPPEGTYLAWLDCRRLELPCPPGEFFRERAGVALVDGAECGQSGRGHVRLNFATPLPILDMITTRMARALGPEPVPCVT